MIHIPRLKFMNDQAFLFCACLNWIRMFPLSTTAGKIKEEYDTHVKDYAEQIEAAWLKRDEDEALSIAFGVKFSVEKGDNICDVSIAFTPEKIKDHTKFVFDEKQDNLPGIPKPKIDKDKTKKEGLLPKDKKK